MFTSAVAQTNFNAAFSQASINVVFPASASLVKAALLALMLSQFPTIWAQEVQPGANGELLAQTPLNAESGDKGVTGQNEVLQGFDVLPPAPITAESSDTGVAAESDDKGETWMGHYFDYATYPHGHFDCAHGSTVFDLDRSLDNEQKRRVSFLEFGNCFRGIHPVQKVTADEIVVCNSNGQITRTATTREL